MENPFKLGTIVEEDYFTDRVEVYSDHYELEDPFFKEWILVNNH